MHPVRNNAVYAGIDGYSGAAAPRQYAGKLTQLLVEAGAQPTWLPGVEISALHQQDAGEVVM